GTGWDLDTHNIRFWLWAKRTTSTAIEGSIYEAVTKVIQDEDNFGPYCLVGNDTTSGGTDGAPEMVDFDGYPSFRSFADNNFGDRPWYNSYIVLEDETPIGYYLKTNSAASYGNLQMVKLNEKPANVHGNSGPEYEWVFQDETRWHAMLRYSRFNLES